MFVIIEVKPMSTELPKCSFKTFNKWPIKSTNLLINFVQADRQTLIYNIIYITTYISLKLCTCYSVQTNSSLLRPRTFARLIFRSSESFFAKLMSISALVPAPGIFSNKPVSILTLETGFFRRSLPICTSFCMFSTEESSDELVVPVSASHWSPHCQQNISIIKTTKMTF